jgi:multidrug transporter EmrE-like cation transporter
MLNYRKSNERLSLKWTVFSLLTFTSNGICSLIQKQHQLMYPGSFRTEFMICAMACMVVILLAVIWVKKEAKSTLIFCLQGSTAGFLEAAANYIVLFLAATQNASVLFPVVSVAKILAVWVIGRIAFHEKTRFLQTLGLVAGIAAILLLNL